MLAGDFEILDAVLAQAVASGLAPGVVAAVTERGGSVHAHAAGFAATAAGRPLRTDAIFRVASMTKLSGLPLPRFMEERIWRPLGMTSTGFELPEDAAALVALHRRSVCPARSLDFAFMDETQKFGFNVLIETRRSPDGRAAGSFGWAGIFNTWFWVDPTAGIAAVVLMQLAPFCDAGCLDLYRRAERAIYRALG